MFDANSRYAKLPISIYTRPSDGRRIPWVQRRLAPQLSSIRTDSVASVKPGERLDNITAQTLGDPTLFWRIADANGALDPFRLCAPGKVLRIPR